MWSVDWNPSVRSEIWGDTLPSPKMMVSRSSGCIRAEAIGVNGLHAVVVAPVLVRVEILRKGTTYELLITERTET